MGTGVDLPVEALHGGRSEKKESIFRPRFDFSGAPLGFADGNTGESEGRAARMRARATGTGVDEGEDDRRGRGARATGEGEERGRPARRRGRESREEDEGLRVDVEKPSRGFSQNYCRDILFWTEGVINMF